MAAGAALTVPWISILLIWYIDHLSFNLTPSIFRWFKHISNTTFICTDYHTVSNSNSKVQRKEWMLLGDMVKRINIWAWNHRTLGTLGAWGWAPLALPLKFILHSVWTHSYSFGIYCDDTLYPVFTSTADGWKTNVWPPCCHFFTSQQTGGVYGIIISASKSVTTALSRGSTGNCTKTCGKFCKKNSHKKVSAATSLTGMCCVVVRFSHPFLKCMSQHCCRYVSLLQCM